MKFAFGCLFALMLSQVSEAQYLYKDLVVTRQNNARWQLYRDNGIRTVTLKSLEGNGQTTEGFAGEQQVSADGLHITTHTKTSGTADSWILAEYSAQGRMIRNTDTSDTYQSVTEYGYDTTGHIISITNTSTETDNHLKDVEQHLWSYDPAHPGKPASMIKIKNGKDTTFVRFVSDAKGNIAEERSSRQGVNLPTVYYYYDADNRLTDIVRYNVRAQRLLPLNIFEYEEGRLSSMMVVPEEGNTFYQKWYYTYDAEKGLKTKDICYNKQKELLGSIEYQYSFK